MLTPALAPVGTATIEGNGGSSGSAWRGFPRGGRLKPATWSPPPTYTQAGGPAEAAEGRDS